MQIPYVSEVRPELADMFSRTVQETMKIFWLYMKDTEIPLEDRWSVFQTVLPYTEVKPYFMRFDSLKSVGFDDTWFDDYYIDRYQTVKFDMKFIELTVEQFPSIDMDSLKEEILQKGYGGFIHDW